MIGRIAASSAAANKIERSIHRHPTAAAFGIEMHLHYMQAFFYTPRREKQRSEGKIENRQFA